MSADRLRTVPTRPRAALLALACGLALSGIAAAPMAWAAPATTTAPASSARCRAASKPERSTRAAASDGTQETTDTLMTWAPASTASSIAAAKLASVPEPDCSASSLGESAPSASAGGGVR